MNFYSSCHFNFKINTIKTLLYRAYELTSSWANFNNEVNFLQEFFKSNYFPTKIFWKQLSHFLNSKYRLENTKPSVPKLPFYCKVPFLFNNMKFYTDITKIISDACPAVKCNIIPINPLSLKSFFNYKDKLSPMMTSNIVYLFTCPKCQLGKYVGASKRLLKVRIDCHRGVSYRTQNKISNPEFSSIRDHIKKHKADIEYQHFQVLGKVTSQFELPIYESLFIKQVVPQLNNHSTAAPLYIA